MSEKLLSGKTAIITGAGSGVGKATALLFACEGACVEFKDSDEETWDWILGVNLKGTMICSRALINQMIKQKHGKIINLTGNC